MTSLTDLREVVDVVIGVFTPTSTPTPRRWSMLALVVSSTRSPSRRQPEGYAELVEFADNHGECRGPGRSRAPAGTAPV